MYTPRPIRPKMKMDGEKMNMRGAEFRSFYVMLAVYEATDANL